MNFKEPVTLSYVAGRFEERGRLELLPNDNFRISLRTTDELPITLQHAFGGTVFASGKPRRNWYRVQGQQAVVLLETLLPYLRNWREPANQILAMTKSRAS